MIWKEIDGYPKYEVSDNGKVRNKKTRRELRQQMSNRDYDTVSLVDETGKHHICTVQRLVCAAYNEGDTTEAVRHKDGNRHNNNADNLEWITKEKLNPFGVSKKCNRVP